MLATLKNWFFRGRLENPHVPLSGKNIAQYFGWGTESDSGEIVNTGIALSYSPVWQGLDTITSDISRIPFVVYRRVEQFGGEGKERAREHPAYRIMRNHTGEMTANLWLARMVGHALMYGNGYSEIFFRNNRVSSLRWLHSDRVKAERKNGKLVYTVRYRGEEDGYEGERELREGQMFHLVGLTLDELGGMSIVEYARNTVGRQLAAERFGDDFFKNFAVPSGWFEHPGEMSEDAQKRFISAVEARHRGAGKRFRAGILEEGMKYSGAGISPEDALLVDQLRWGVKDVARFFNLPPHRLGDDSRTGYNSVEQENRSYFNTTLGKWVSRIEAESSWKLFNSEELMADDLFVEAKQDALFKADTAARFQAYSLAIQNGIMSRNEVRAAENLNPVEGGDQFLVPLNMGQPGEDEPAAEEEPEDTPPDTADRAVRIQGLVCESLQRGCRLLVNEAKKAGTNPSKFLAWLNGMENAYRSRLMETISPAVTLAAIDGGDEQIMELQQQVFNEIIRAVAEIFLSASECQPDRLLQRIGDTLSECNDLCRRLSADLVLGGITQ